MLTYKLIPTSDLIPYARNSRTHSEAQVTKIASSIKEFGFINPVVTDGKNGIVAGHGRVLAANKLGLKEVPCVEASHLTEAQKRAYVIADNRMALDAGWDIDLLKVELGDLQGMDFDLSLTGFDPGELENFLAEKTDGLTDPDAVPETPANPVTVLGDVWLMGKHRLMCGDSTSVDAVEKLMAGQKADMVFTDPPYGMKLDTDYSSIKGSAKAKIKNLGGKKYDRIIGDHDDFTPELISTVFACFDYVDEIFLWGADYYAELLPNKNDGSWVVWDKRGSEDADRIVGSCFELCWSKQKHKRDIARVKWMGAFGHADARNRVHPSQKPLALCDWFFERWGSSGDVVVDLYGGSGTTLIAAEEHGRHAKLMELDPKYCDVIVKRWQEFTGHKATLESTGQTFEDVASSRYDWKKDSAASYDVAIAEKRKELEAST
jgi:DNA modification methylase